MVLIRFDTVDLMRLSRIYVLRDFVLFYYASVECGIIVGCEFWFEKEST
jgi:hypothetical protein